MDELMKTKHVGPRFFPKTRHKIHLLTSGQFHFKRRNCEVEEIGEAQPAGPRSCGRLCEQAHDDLQRVDHFAPHFVAALDQQFVQFTVANEVRESLYPAGDCSVGEVLPLELWLLATGHDEAIQRVTQERIGGEKLAFLDDAAGRRHGQQVVQPVLQVVAVVKQ